MMRSSCSRLAASCSVAALASVTLGLASASGAERAALAIVPPGITLVEVVRELQSSAAQVLWIRPGDAEGRTLFIADRDQPGVATCVASCAEAFPPLLAAAGAKPVGDWSLVRRPEGLQWAYQTHPLYIWSEEQEPGEVATNVGLNETANLKLAENPTRAGSLLPPAGWQVARFDPAASMPVPDGIEVKLVASAQAVILTDFEGRTLYAFAGDAKLDSQPCSERGCEMRWLPVAAPELAMGVADFTVVTRSDGSKQWAYQTQPLYRYSGDLLPGDVRGLGVAKGWTLAILRDAFRPAGVTVTTLEGYGDALALNGMTLYSGSAFQKYWGGRNLRDSFKNAYNKGKKLGGNACLDADCLQTWRPFLAPADAVAHGFWEPIARPDGRKQWAYKGYALYTYAGDTAPGQHTGQATYAFAKLEGSSEDVERVEWLAGITKAGGGAGVYWNVAKP